MNDANFDPDYRFSITRSADNWATPVLRECFQEITITARNIRNKGIRVTISGFKYGKKFPIIERIYFATKAPVEVMSAKIDFSFDSEGADVKIHFGSTTKTRRVEREKFSSAVNQQQPVPYKPSIQVSHKRYRQMRRQHKILLLKRKIKKLFGLR